MALSKEDILGAKDTTVRAIDVPEWGGETFIRVLTGTELDALTTAMAKLGGERSTQPSAIAAEFVVRCVCDADGKRLFDDKDVGSLVGKSTKVLTRIAEDAMGLNGLTEEAAATLKGNS
jgi:hypothetical protein